MKQSKMKNRLLLLSFVVSSMLLCGCTDGDYKISSVDAKLGIGNGNLTLPSNSSVVVTLDDILKLGDTDVISVDANGDYHFGKNPESLNDVKVQVDRITSSGSSSTLSFPGISLPTSIQALAGQTVKPSDYGISLAQNGDISLMDYQFTVPTEVEKLNYLVLGNGTPLKIEVSLAGVTNLSKLEITLPQQLVVTNLNGGTFDSSTNKLALTNQPVSGGKVVLNFLVTRINTTLNANHTVTLNSKVHMSVDIAELTVPSASSLSVSGVVTMDNLTITAANGRFNPTIDVQELGSTVINSLPDFLTDARVVADIDNPQVWLTLESNFPLGGYVEAKLSSTTASADVVLDKAHGNELPVVANGTTRLVVCRKAPEGLSGYTAVIAPDLSNLVKKLQEGMKLSFDITKYEADRNSDVTVDLGRDYILKPGYNFTAPLALGDQAEIVYSSTESNWNKDLKKLEMTKNASLFVTASVNNGVPADLEINVKPIDVNGAELSALTVKPILHTVAAGETSGTVKYEIVDPNGVGLKNLDGIQYELLVTSPSAASGQKGKKLNSLQKIIIKTTDLHLQGSVIYDAN